MDTAPDRGALSINVELAPFSTADWRPGRAPELISTVSERLCQVLVGTSGTISGSGSVGSTTAGVFPLSQLCLSEGKAVWNLSLDVYILNADGAVFDAVLLAAVAALAGTKVIY